jgi:hypothetical protein
MALFVLALAALGAITSVDARLRDGRPHANLRPMAPMPKARSYLLLFMSVVD